MHPIQISADSECISPPQLGSLAIFHLPVRLAVVKWVLRPQDTRLAQILNFDLCALVLMLHIHQGILTLKSPGGVECARSTFKGLPFCAQWS